jgi:hypothetical protein
MKIIKTTLLFGGLLALAMSLNAESPMIKVNVPFAFVVGGTAMPAGTYTIEEPAIQGVLVLRGNQPNSTAMVLAVNGGPSTSPQAGVTFTHRGSDVVLSTVSVPGGSNYTLINLTNSSVLARK